MANFTFTSNMKLRSINELNEVWFLDWVYNFNRLDTHDHSANKGIQIPTGGIADGAVTQVKTAFGFYESSWITGTGTTTFAHGFSGLPHLVQLNYDDNGTIVIYGDGSHIEYIDTTNIELDFTLLTIDATHKLKINAFRF